MIEKLKTKDWPVVIDADAIILDNFDFFKYVPKHYYYGNDLFFSLITNHIKKIKSEKIYYRHLDYGNKDDALSKSGQNIKNYINIIKDWFKVDYVDINIIKKNIEVIIKQIIGGEKVK